MSNASVEFRSKSFHTIISMSIDCVPNVEDSKRVRDRLPNPFHSTFSTKQCQWRNASEFHVNMFPQLISCRLPSISWRSNCRERSTYYRVSIEFQLERYRREMRWKTTTIEQYELMTSLNKTKLLFFDGVFLSRRTDFVFVPQTDVRLENSNETEVIATNVLKRNRNQGYYWEWRARRTNFLQTWIGFNRKNVDRLIFRFDSNVEWAILQTLRFVFARHGRTRRDLQRIPLLDKLISTDHRQRNINKTDQIVFIAVVLLLFASFDFTINFAPKFRTTWRRKRSRRDFSSLHILPSGRSLKVKFSPQKRISRRSLLVVFP